MINNNFFSQYFYILRGHAKSLVLILFSFGLVSFLDMLGIGLIGPFIALIVNPTLGNNGFFRWLFSITGFSTDAKQTILFAGIILIGLFIGKGLLTLVVQHKIYKFCFFFRASLVDRLMHAYLQMPYHFFLKRSSASIIQAVIEHTKLTVDDLILPSFKFASDIIALIVIFLFLCWISLSAALILTMLLIISAIAYAQYVRPKVRLAGKEADLANEKVIRNVSESFAGIKEIKTLCIENEMADQVSDEAKKTAIGQITFRTLLALPRNLMEVVLVVFVVLFSVVAVFWSSDTKSLISTLAVFGMAGIRLLPASVSVSSSLVSMNYASHSLNSLYNDLKSIEHIPEIESPISLKERKYQKDFLSLELKALTYTYPGSNRKAINGITLTIQSGQMIGIMGESGAGKTTLVDLLLGLHDYDNGNITINNIEVAQYGWRKWLDQVAYIPQFPLLIDDTLEKNIAFGVPEHLMDVNQLNEAIRCAHLSSLLIRLPDGKKTVLGERGIRLSGGERQRIALARAFYHNRRVFIFDEATSALDIETEEQVVNALNELKGTKTVILISHRLATIQRCDVIYRMKAGKIIAVGSLEEVMSSHFECEI